MTIVAHIRQSAFVRTKNAVDFERLVGHFKVGRVATGLNISFDNVRFRRNFPDKRLRYLFWAVPQGRVHGLRRRVVETTPKTPKFFWRAFIAGSVAQARTFQFVLKGYRFDRVVFQFSFDRENSVGGRRRHGLSLRSSRVDRQLETELP